MRNGFGSISLICTCLVAGSLGTVGCAANTTGGGGGGTDGGVGNDGGGTGGWTAVPLVDDTTNPSKTVYRKGNDLVTGIYYESADKGFIVTQGDGESSTNGGAVFKATGSAVGSVAFGGDGTGITLDGAIAFTGLERTSSGYIAMAYASDVITSSDGGATFAIARNGNSDQLGIEPVLAYKASSSGTTLVRDTGVVTVSSGAPGPAATYEDIWAPNATPPIPDPVPVQMCQSGPLGTGAPVTRYSVHVSVDRGFIAYTADPAHQPEICISDDGGHTFFPHALDNVPATAVDFPSTGVAFTSRTSGIAWFAHPTGGKYVKRTIDGGVTWTNGALPSEVTSSELELPAGFFAPDGLHGWLAGYDHTGNAAILLATADGGATWTKVAGIAAAVDAAHGDKLYSGFALDATHVWIGGARGLLMHN